MAPNVPLYMFQLPSSLLDDFKPRQLHIPESHPLHPSKRATAAAATTEAADTVQVAPGTLSQAQSNSAPGQFTCQLTGASFADLSSLREHYRTDWYKYNVKLKLQGKPTPVSEEQFNALVEGLSESISGSDSSSATEDDSDIASTSSSTNAVSRLLKKQRLDNGTRGAQNKDDDDEDNLLESLNGPRSALMWFEASNVNPGTQYGVYRAALPVAGSGKKRVEGPEVLEEIKSLQLPEVSRKGDSSTPDKERKWTLLMFGGGHFAGMVVSLVPKLVSGGKGKEKEKEVVILARKTFHRYTTRRKQGGAQSANDAGKGKAKSAGAQIRRYNESMLTDEVRELLDGWREHIDESELVFLRCSKNNYRTFFGYDEAVLDRKDSRIRGFSFPTRRPTVNELVRSFTELTRVKVSHLSADALAQLDADYLASITPVPKPATPQPKAPAPKPAVIKLTREEELDRDRWTRCVDMVRKGKIEPLAAFLDKYGPELEQAQASAVWGTLPSWMDESKTTPTLLHVASSADQPEMVRWLLVEKRADPTLRPGPELGSSTNVARADGALNDSTAQSAITTADRLQVATAPRLPLTPYELAPSRATRNVFRLLTTEHPNWWDWTGTGIGGARVPSGLDVEKEGEREQKGRERRAMLRDKLKERDKERAEKERVEKEREEQERRDKEARELEELRRRGGTGVTASGPKRLGGGPPAAMLKQQQAGLTEQQKMRIEREQRARAAEARLAKLAGGT